MAEANKMASFKFGQLASELILHHYKGEQSLDEILQWTWDKYPDEFSLQPSEKAGDKADMLRLLGNQCYKEKEYLKALESYNLSIMAAPHPVLNDKIEETKDDFEFAVPRINPSRYGGVPLEMCSALGKGFANRSAVMLDLGEYEKCLQDIDLAIEYGYPEELRPKLEERRLKCQEARRRGDTSNCTTGDFLENPNLFIQRASLKKSLAPNLWKVPVMEDPNPCIPAFSSAAKLSYCPQKGRRVIASRDIKPGEILGIERAFAVVVDGSQLSTHCSTCTQQCLNPLPCPGCSQVIFCSKSCRLRGLSEDHWLECKILTSVCNLGLELKAFSYKLLKTFSFRQIKSISNELESEKRRHPRQLGFDSKGIYRSSSYRSVYHLHHDLATDSVEELIFECMLAFVLAKLLEFSERFFVDDSGVPLPVTKEDIFETCKILINNSKRCGLNSLAPFQQVGLMPFHLQNSATRLFPAECLVKHSCSSVTSHVYIGRESCWYSLKPIAAGEELTVLNFAGFSVAPKRQRKAQLLMNSRFVCNCQACEENWPTIVHLPDIKLLCVDCNKPSSKGNMHCNACSKKIRSGTDAKKVLELQMISQKVKSAFDVLSQMQKKVACKEPITKLEFRRLCEASEIAFKHSAMPSKALVNFMNLVDVCAGAGLL